MPNRVPSVHKHFSARSSKEELHDLQDRTQAALLYYDDVSNASGTSVHALVYAGLLAAYELRGEAWIEHCYFYDRVGSLRGQKHSQLALLESPMYTAYLCHSAGRHTDGQQGQGYSVPAQAPCPVGSQKSS
jgi:hypothetical protein